MYTILGWLWDSSHAAGTWRARVFCSLCFIYSHRRQVLYTRTVHIVDILLYIKGDYMHLSVCCRLLKVYNIIYTYISYEYSVRVYGRK